MLSIQIPFVFVCSLDPYARLIPLDQPSLSALCRTPQRSMPCPIAAICEMHQTKPLLRGKDVNLEVCLESSLLNMKATISIQ